MVGGEEAAAASPLQQIRSRGELLARRKVQQQPGSRGAAEACGGGRKYGGGKGGRWREGRPRRQRRVVTGGEETAAALDSKELKTDIFTHIDAGSSHQCRLRGAGWENWYGTEVLLCSSGFF